MLNCNIFLQVRPKRLQELLEISKGFHSQLDPELLQDNFETHLSCEINVKLQYFLYVRLKRLQELLEMPQELHSQPDPELLQDISEPHLVSYEINFNQTFSG